MRLWTFQHKEVYEKLKRYGVWYSDLEFEEHLKYVDERYSQKDVETPWGIIDTAPIYCFSSTKDYEGALSLHNMYESYCSFTHYMRFSLKSLYMVELEVPESFIVSSKKVEDWYVEYPDMPTEVPSYRHREYAKIVREDEIELKNHLRYARNTPGATECLIPYISIEHVAAIREFETIGNKEDVNASCCKVSTIYVGKEAPLWSIDIYCSGTGYPSVLEAGKIVGKPLSEITNIQHEDGLYCAYDYMSIEDIYECCCSAVTDVVDNFMLNRGVEYKDVKHLTFDELQIL